MLVVSIVFVTFVIPETVSPVRVPIDTICVWVEFTENVFPDNVNPVPADKLPAVENCVNVNAFVPTTSDPVKFVTIHPVAPFAVPASTKTNNPAAWYPVLKSDANVGAPVEFTM